MAYEVVTNRVALMRPAVGPNGGPRSIWRTEKEAGKLFIENIREPGGDVKFGPYTYVTVSKRDASNTCVELSSTKYGLIRGSHHLFFLERARWKELQQLLTNDVKITRSQL